MSELIDFVMQWPFQKIDDKELLLGYPLFQWSRAGELMQFIGGSLIIFNLIGFDKLKKFTWILVGSTILFLVLFTFFSFFAFIKGIEFNVNEKELFAYIAIGTIFFSAILGIIAAKLAISVTHNNKLEKFMQYFSFILLVLGTFLQMVAA
jgi:hypothetical protein